MKLVIALSVLLVATISVLVINTDFSESEILNPDRISYKIPEWVKHNAYWWSQDMISEDEFAFSIEYLFDKGIIKETTCVGECIEEH